MRTCRFSLEAAHLKLVSIYTQDFGSYRTRSYKTKDICTTTSVIQINVRYLSHGKFRSSVFLDYLPFLTGILAF